jgi:hypothetical protein
LDDLPRALVIRGDGVQTVTDPREVGRLAIEKPAGGLGIKENRCQRLVELVRKRGRQFSHGRHAIQVGDFVQAPAHCAFGLLPIGDVDANPDNPANATGRISHWDEIRVEVPASTRQIKFVVVFDERTRFQTTAIVCGDLSGEIGGEHVFDESTGYFRTR